MPYKPAKYDTCLPQRQSRHFDHLHRGVHDNMLHGGTLEVYTADQSLADYMARLLLQSKAASQLCPQESKPI